MASKITYESVESRNLLSRINWREYAACRDTDSELFFPVGTKGPDAEKIALAKSICHSCPVRNACLRYAIDAGEDAGIWGGATEEERRMIKRRTHGNR